MRRILASVLVFAAASVAAGDAPQPFRIRVIDDQTGRGVPLVELRTTNDIRFHTDSAGNVAIIEPGLLGQKVFFHVSSHGYEFPKDGFGFRGRALDVTPGGAVELRMHRLNTAERLYRVTGGGIYRDSVLLGDDPPIREPLLNAQVLGQDSVLTAVYGGRMYWFWGDTNRPSYPLGNFQTTGATSLLPDDGGLDPAVGVDLEYFQDEKGFTREMASMPGDGPTWLGGLVVLRNGDDERMFAGYVKIRNFLDVYRHGLAEFDPETGRFEEVAVFPEGAPAYPTGHPFLHRDGGVEYVYFASPYPLTRVPADPDALADLSRYESFTCLRDGSDLENPQVVRNGDGTPVYSWRRDAPAVGAPEQKKLVEAGVLKPDEGLLPLRDVETGRPVVAHGGSVYWNDHRRRWVMIAVEIGGESSHLGEVWFAEADTPLGPWIYARKIVTHDRYSFYNPKQHPMFDQDSGRIIYFEGTYTALFSGNPTPTPRYDYNQILYRLDLDDPRLALPVPVYRARSAGFRVGAPEGEASDEREIAFFALDRPGRETVALVEQTKAGQLVLNVAEGDSRKSAVFYAMPADADAGSPDVIPLYEFVESRSGRRYYATEADEVPVGFVRAERPLCRVWRAIPGASCAVASGTDR